MKQLVSLVVLCVAVMSLGADKPQAGWQRDWDRRSFCTTMTVLAYNAEADGEVSDAELIEIAKAGFSILEPKDAQAKLMTEVRIENDARVVFIAHDYETRFLGYTFTFSKRGKFEKLIIVPSE